MPTVLISIPDIENYQLSINIDDGLLTSAKYVKLDEQIKHTSIYSSELGKRDCWAVNAVTRQFNQYFSQPDSQFDLPLNQNHGTAFQKKVWQALIGIPAGITISYSELANEVNSGARAVANACRQNLFPIVIPCHRVVSKNGIGGYDGDSSLKSKDSKLSIKLALLRHERVLDI